MSVHCYTIKEQIMKIENQISANNSCRPKANTSSYVVMVLSSLLGGVSMILFGIFLYTGLPSQMDLGLMDKQTFLSTACFVFSSSFNTA